MKRLVGKSIKPTPAASGAARSALGTSIDRRFLRCAGATSLIALAGFVLVSCGSKESKAPPPTPADAAPVDPTAPADAQERARIAQAVAFRQGVEPLPPAIKLRGGEPATPEVLMAYNQELARLIFKEGDAPESLQELAQKKGLPRLPTPPGGKRIIYDARNRIIKLDPP